MNAFGKLALASIVALSISVAPLSVPESRAAGVFVHFGTQHVAGVHVGGVRVVVGHGHPSTSVVIIKRHHVKHHGFHNRHGFHKRHHEPRRPIGIRHEALRSEAGEGSRFLSPRRGPEIRHDTIRFGTTHHRFDHGRVGQHRVGVEHFGTRHWDDDNRGMHSRGTHGRPRERRSFGSPLIKHESGFGASTWR